MKAASPNGKWGLWDTVDGYWMGTDDGPLRFDEEIFAKIAAQVLSVQLGWEEIRIKPKLFDSATQIHDELELKMSTGKALDRLEKGGMR